MPQTHSNYRVGDCVRVKAGTKDPDFGIDMEGWQGRVLGADTEAGETVVHIHWDSITLRNMPVSMIEQCKERGLDWAEMGLDAREVEPAKSRDTEQDVAKIKAELANEYGWSALGEEGKRIRKVLAGVNQDDIMDALGAWEEHLEEKLTFPFEAEVTEFQERGPLRGGDKVIVAGISDVTDDLYGIIVDLKVGRRKYAFPLCDLEATDKKSANYQLVNDYATWFANR